MKKFENTCCGELGKGPPREIELTGFPVLRAQERLGAMRFHAVNLR